VVWVVLLGAAAGGCGDETARQPVSPPDFSTFLERWHDLWCGEPLECRRFETEADCRASAAAATAQTEVSVSRGRVIYHAEYAEACLAAWDRLLRCRASERAGASSETVSLACDPTFEGAVPEDGACFSDSECQSDRCEQADPACLSDQQCCPGSCGVASPPPEPEAIGASCIESYECVDGAYCSGEICTAYLGAGAACASGLCAAPLVCAGSVCSPPVAAPDRGASCSDQCDRDDDFCNPTSGCCEARREAGGACTLPDATGTPNDPPMVTVGESRECALYAFCADGVCTASSSARTPAPVCGQ